MRGLWAALALLWAAPALAQQPVTHAVLDNGMEVVVIEDHRAPVVVHMMWLKAGAADEAPGQSGVAHYLEHLLFKSTETREAGEFSRIVAAHGGSDNAFTSYDYTAYFQRVPVDQLGQMMALEADRLQNLSLTEEDAATELRVILEERSQRTDSDPGALAGEQFAAAQYLAHPYGTPVIGWRHDMETLTREDARAFYDLMYAPNNAVLVVAGDVTPDAVLALARQHYGPIPANPDLRPRQRAQEPPQRAARRVIYRDDRVGQPYLLRSYLVPERDAGAQDQAAALAVLAELLGGSPFTSVLARALQFDTQVAVFTGAGYGATSLDATRFTLSLAPADGIPMEEVEAALDAALAQFAATGPSEEQMQAVRTRLAASEIYDSDNTRRLAERYGRALTQGLTVADVADWPAALQAVTAEDVLAAAALLVPEHSVTGYVLGQEGGD